MQILVNTGHDIDGSVALTTYIKAVVKKALHHMEGQITRVEVHLDDEHGSKGGTNDKVCKMEARPRHHQSLIVSHKAASIHQAVDGASRKLKSSLEHLIGRLEDQQRHSVNINEDSSQ